MQCLVNCSSPATPYAPAQLLLVSAVAPPDSAIPFTGSRLCNGFGSEWDSVLVVHAYTSPADIRAFRIENYLAIHWLVVDQEYNEGVCTLLFVKSNRYTAYSVFPRTIDWSAFADDKASKTALAWLTPQDCERLTAKGWVTSGHPKMNYTVRLSQP